MSNSWWLWFAASALFAIDDDGESLLQVSNALLLGKSLLSPASESPGHDEEGSWVLNSPLSPLALVCFAPGSESLGSLHHPSSH